MTRRLWIVIAALLLLAACHRKPKPSECDSVASVSATDSVVVDSVSAIIVPGDSATGEKLLPVHRDTTETTALRLFARKQTTIYSPSLLTGEWLRGSEHEQYAADGTGTRWDTVDDIHRDEAQHFSWTMDSNILTFKYPIALGGLMVRQYVVTFVDDETLVYRDAYGDAYMWEKSPD